MGADVISEKQLVESRTFLSNVGFWPSPTDTNYEGWLQNFDEGADRETAAALLESLVHINETQIVHGTISGLRALSASPEFGPADQRQGAWETFLDSAYISFPSGGEGDVTGSGHIFARIVKSTGFPENRILASDELVRRLAKRPIAAPAVFLDDLAASGTQFKRSWTRMVSTDAGKKSLQTLTDQGLLGPIYYVPIVATQKALDLLAKETPLVKVRPIYRVEPEYFASDALTRLVPSDLRPGLKDFLSKYSPLSGRDDYGPFGFGEIGLALSFHHSTPNNTLPILQKGSPTSAASWKPITS